MSKTKTPSYVDELLRVFRDRRILLIRQYATFTPPPTNHRLAADVDVTRSSDSPLLSTFSSRCGSDGTWMICPRPAKDQDPWRTHMETMHELSIEAQRNRSFLQDRIIIYSGCPPTACEIQLKFASPPTQGAINVTPLLPETPTVLEWISPTPHAYIQTSHTIHGIRWLTSLNAASGTIISEPSTNFAAIPHISGYLQVAAGCILRATEAQPRTSKYLVQNHTDGAGEITLQRSRLHLKTHQPSHKHLAFARKDQPTLVTALELHDPCSFDDWYARHEGDRDVLIDEAQSLAWIQDLAHSQISQRFAISVHGDLLIHEVEKVLSLQGRTSTVVDVSSMDSSIWEGQDHI